EHLADYLKVLVTRSRNPDYPAEVERTLKRLVAARNMVVLGDLTADAVQQYLAHIDVGARTRNLHRTYVVSFGNYLVGAGRLPVNPVNSFTVARAKAKDTDDQRERRALRPTELRRLLEAARDYPLAVVSTNTGGRSESRARR